MLKASEAYEKARGSIEPELEIISIAIEKAAEEGEFETCIDINLDGVHDAILTELRRHGYSASIRYHNDKDIHQLLVEWTKG